MTSGNIIVIEQVYVILLHDPALTMSKLDMKQSIFIYFFHYSDCNVVCNPTGIGIRIVGMLP